MKKNEGKIRSINSCQDREKLQESEFDSRLRSDFINEGKRIAKELENDARLDCVRDNDSELLNKIVGQLREEGKWDDEAYQKEAEQELYSLLPEEDQIALRRGRRLAKIEQHWKKKRKVIMHHVAAMVIVGSVLMAGFGVEANRNYVMQILGKFTSRGQRVVINKTDDEVVHGKEEYDRQKIKEETGIDAPCFIYRPSTWVYEECVIDAETRNARMFYTNENQYQFFIYMNKESNNIQEVLDVEGKILSEYDIFDRYLRINIRVQNLQGNKEKDYYKAEFNYNDTYYLVIGKMEKEEFDQIIEKIMF
jgi:hypothetical protein